MRARSFLPAQRRVRSPAIGTPAQIAAFKPKVAVLIPAYNEEKVIERTVRSALNSDYPNLHVIVIDDGSKDRTAEVAESFRRAFPSLRVISNGVNRGKGFSVRHGMLEARGRNVLFTDADLSAAFQEVARENKFDIVLDYVWGHPTEVLINALTGRELMPDEVTPIRYITIGAIAGPTIALPSAALRSTLGRGCWWHISGWAIRLDALDDIGGFNPQLPQLGDWDWLLRCLARGW